MIEVQTLTESDWRTWRSLRLRALRDAPFAFGSRYENWKDAPEEQWRQRFQNPAILNLIAVRDGVPVGMAGATDGERVELISMWVAEEARGVGIGDALIAAVEPWAHARANELWLAVVPANSSAIAAYVRNGFEPVDDTGDPLPEGSRNEMLMRKRLGVRLKGQLVCATFDEASIVESHLREHRERTLAEPGCLSFSVIATADPFIWQVDEHFRDAEAFRSHQDRVAESAWGRATAGIERRYSVLGI